MGTGNRRHAFAARLLAGVTVLLLFPVLSCFAQTRNEFWPGFDAYIKLKPRTRLYLMAALVRAQEPEAASGGIYRDIQLGAHLDISLKPIFRRKLAMKGDWDRERYLWARIGYRYGTTLGGVEDPFHEHRGIVELTGRAPLPRDFWIVLRNRVDLRDVNGNYSTRYRIRLAVEREVRLFGLETVPYVNAEVSYDSRYDAWNRQRYQAGLEVALSKRWRIEPYYTRQNDSRSDMPHLNAFGLSLKYYR